MTGSSPTVAASRTAGIAEMIGPDDRHQLEDAGHHRQQDRVPAEHGIHEPTEQQAAR